MSHRAESVFRQKRCVFCQSIFWICRSCDHGDRYCRFFCRQSARLEQRRQANRRHQRSQEGRLDHRDRQRAYRARRRARVTDQGRPRRPLSASIRLAPESAPFEWRDPRRRTHARYSFTVCIRCGRAVGLVDPFHSR